MARHRVLVTDHDFDDLGIERDVLGDVADVRALSNEPGDVALEPDRLADADAVVTLRAELDATAIDAMDRCRVIARYGTGVDNVDVEAATRRGIHVTNVPTYCVDEVSTHAVALVTALARRIPTYDRSVEAGEWDRDAAAPIHRFATRTVGVVGFGTIGRAVGEKAAALGADVLASDPYLEPSDVDEYAAELVAFEELLGRSDFVTIHSPLTDDTRGLFDGAAFRRMKPDASLVNVARGPIVDDEALVAALDAGEIAGAGLDVVPDEPPAADDPIRDHGNVVTTPHVAWYSEEANAERRRTAGEDVRAVLEGCRPANAVNEIG